jgi:hypothetical protein
MKSFIGSILFLIVALPSLFGQDSLPAAYDVEKMTQILKKAGDLQSTEPQSVAQTLAPLLEESRRLRQNGMLTADASRILKDALLLMMRTQIMLLTPEREILTFVREILITDPKIEESFFNPREKLLVKKIRSAETGNLSLETTPPGASISYQGKELGVTPIELNLIAGDYKIKLSLLGYLDQDFNSTIQPSETLTLSRTMRRRAVEIPIAINSPSTTIVLNGKNLGASQGYQTWLASLPAERQREYDAAVQQWNIDRTSFSFFRLIDIPVDEKVKLEFQAACYQPLALEFTVLEKDVDWTRTISIIPELQNVQLAKDTGSIEVSSTPSGAEVWLDGSLQGRTPLNGKELCSGTHRLQILHDSGQYVQEVAIQRGRTSIVRSRLKPALAFLGIYTQNPPSKEPAIIANDSKTVAKSIALNCRSFTDPLIAPEDVELLRQKSSLPINQLTQDATETEDKVPQIKKISAALGRSELLLLGLRTDTGYRFKLYSILHPNPDIIDIAALDETSLNFLISQLNKTDKVRERLQVADPGLEVADSPNGLIVQNISSAIADRKTALAPGQIIKSIDAKQMSFADFQSYLRSKKSEQTVVFEVKTGKDKVTLVPIPLRQTGTEYPWNTPDGFQNSVFTILRNFVEADPLADEAKYAALSLARGFMKLKEWKTALEYLAKANLEPNKSGICPGTVLYYQGQCHEALGNRAQAENCYLRAKDYTEATLGMPGGLSISILAEQRLQDMKKH